MNSSRSWGVVAAGVVAMVVGALLLITPIGTHHSGNCGSVVAPSRPTLNNDDTLEEQVLADHDCPSERRFRAGAAAIVIAGGVAAGVVGAAHRRRATTR